MRRRGGHIANRFAGGGEDTVGLERADGGNRGGRGADILPAGQIMTVEQRRGGGGTRGTGKKYNGQK